MPIEVLIQWFLDPHLPQIGDKYGWFISGLKKSSGSQEPLEPPLTAPLVYNGLSFICLVKYSEQGRALDRQLFRTNIRSSYSAPLYGISTPINGAPYIQVKRIWQDK